MAGERTMWLVWIPLEEGETRQGHAEVYLNQEDALREIPNPPTSWRCSQITVKEAEDE